jgi:ABC-2 type transport system ATP-binding protein
MSLLEASHLRKSYNGTVAVDDLSFSVDAGEVFGLLGPNGAGKTTTMMILAGLLRPDSGSVILDGHPLNHDDVTQRFNLGVVPQDLAIYPDLTARENLLFFGRLYGLSGDTLQNRVDAVLDLTGLESCADQMVRTYSGGMKRRLNFGVGLLHKPKLIILDEPTVGVDPQSRSHLLERVREFSRQGTAVLYASHYMEEVQAICDRAAIMDHGKRIACDTLSGLLGLVQGAVQIHIANAGPGLAGRLRGLAEVSNGSGGEARVILKKQTAKGPADVGGPLANVLTILNQEHAAIRSVDTQEANLEQLFLQLTGRHLRD